MPIGNERGLTLTELTIVIVLAAIVTVGLVTFYLNAQGMWIDASSQALTQRDATLVLERMTALAREASDAEVVSDPDTLHQTLIFRDYGGAETARFSWSPADSLIYLGFGPGGDSARGPISASRVQRFRLDTDHKVVYLRELSIASSIGQPVEIASTMALYNR